MKEEILIKVKDFINRFYIKTYKVPLVLENINEGTNIESDLKITGDDADIFLTDLVCEFDLDASDFKGEEYFGYETEGFDIVFPTLRFFLGQRKWMPIPKEQRKDMTIGHLLKCIDERKLI